MGKRIIPVRREWVLKLEKGFGTETEKKRAEQESQSNIWAFWRTSSNWGVKSKQIRFANVEKGSECRLLSAKDRSGRRKA